MSSLIAWSLLPLLVLGLSLGLGALVCGALRLAPEWSLIVCLGAAAAIIMAISGYVVGLRGLVTPLLIAVITVAGLVLGHRRRLLLPRSWLAPFVWLAAYGLFIAPVVLSGHWTWLGYNFVNDTSVQMLLGDWVAEHGRKNPEMWISTTTDVISAYVGSGYPLGSHALLAAADHLLPVRQEALYQPLIATFAGIGALAVFALARTLVPATWAAFAAFMAVASNLLYHYALQGNLKEVVAAALFMATAAVAAWMVGLLRHAAPAERSGLLWRAALLLALPVSAMVHVFSTAGVPYVAAVAGLLLAVLAVQRLLPPLRATVGAALAGTGAVVLATLATLNTLVNFGRVTSATYVDESRALDLGHLSRPLEVRQTAGIWLNADYRLPPTGLTATLTSAGIVLVALLAVVAVVWMIRRRRAEVALACVPVIAIMLAVTPRVSPYADAKTYMLMAPAVTLLGVLGAAVLARWSRTLGFAAAAVLALGVLWSNALAYHDVQLAPIERMEAIRDLDEQLAGQGLVLFNEPEEFAKNFMTETRLNVGAEAVTPRQTQLRVPQDFAYLWFDLDDLTLDYVQGFSHVVVRRSPVASRPPANFTLMYENDYYEVWRRDNEPEVLEHLPLQAVHRPALEPGCQDIRAMADSAAAGERIVAAPAPTQARLDTIEAERSESWVPHPFRQNMVATNGPGRARATAVAEPGRYRAWIAGSFGRPVEGWVDGRRIGAAQGVNNVGQWHEIGTVELDGGKHELELRRDGGGLAPGDGFRSEMGPLILDRIEPRELVEVTPERAARRLCGRGWDWIARVAP